MNKKTNKQLRSTSPRYLLLLLREGGVRRPPGPPCLAFGQWGVLTSSKKAKIPAVGEAIVILIVVTPHSATG